jgi:two-component system, OmpR family, KDP operon response regulator KdpE
MLPQESRILVVEDEPSLRKVLRVSPSSIGFEVEEACAGEEALGLVEQHPFDLVLLDINMPGLTGFEACQRIHSLAPRTRIVMLTARDAEDDKVRALDLGADDYITKPFRLPELLARLRAVLRRVYTRDPLPFEGAQSEG